MRKLNSKNKLYIILLSLFTVICLGIVIVFIVIKVKDYNVKYNISSVSYVFNSDNELVTIKDSAYVKKDFLGTYYLNNNDKNINLGKNAVIYNSSTNELKLLGTFYEIKENGETKKYTGETTISASLNKIFKLGDRKYLVTGKVIKSEDNLLTIENYLLIDLDKVGNSYVYNNVINYKSFGILNLIGDNFKFKTNEEKLSYNDEEIDLAKINGSTNEFFRKNNNNTTNNTVNNTTNGNDNIYEDDDQTFINNIHQTIKENKYVSHKTTIFDAKTSATTVDLTYMVYDPLTEFTKVYTEVYNGENIVGTYELPSGETSYQIKGLNPSTSYRLDFFYEYKTTEGNLINKKFDMISIRTDNVKGQISLEKVSKNSVSYILRIDNKLDSAKASLYIDDVLVATDDTLNLEQAASGGYTGVFNFTASGSMAKIVIENGVLNNENVGVIATYKYKI